MKAESKDGFLCGKKLLKETWLRVKGSHKWLEATIKTEGGSNPPGSFFNNLLVPPLNRALPLIQPQSIAVFISQHLYIKKKHQTLIPHQHCGNVAALRLERREKCCCNEPTHRDDADGIWFYGHWHCLTFFKFVFTTCFLSVLFVWSYHCWYVLNKWTCSLMFSECQNQALTGCMF